ncbi:hypothetical protein Q5530_04945 [Saccharothrix sp. BKS2]|uniref:hypothetical protein n=1 Tax=Saccharothrix sp. BKS2 TaxID=3064400 RepID=UPI0039EC5142
MEEQLAVTPRKPDLGDRLLDLPLATNRTALLSLLLGLATAVGIATGALLLLGDVEVEFREFAVEHRVAPTLLLTCVSA